MRFLFIVLVSLTLSACGHSPTTHGLSAKQEAKFSVKVKKRIEINSAASRAHRSRGTFPSAATRRPRAASSIAIGRRLGRWLPGSVSLSPARLRELVREGVKALQPVYFATNRNVHEGPQLDATSFTAGRSSEGTF